jgi:hypothetical protein
VRVGTAGRVAVKVKVEVEEVEVVRVVGRVAVWAAWAARAAMWAEEEKASGRATGMVVEMDRLMAKAIVVKALLILYRSMWEPAERGQGGIRWERRKGGQFEWRGQQYQGSGRRAVRLLMGGSLKSRL